VPSGQSICTSVDGCFDPRKRSVIRGLRVCDSLLAKASLGCNPCPVARSLSGVARTHFAQTREASLGAKTRQKTCLQVTIHNYHPKGCPLGRELYQSVYKYADAFVHLGQQSLKWFIEKNKDQRWCSSAIHEVIQHGEYTFYDGLAQENNAILRHPALLDKVYLVFGSIWKNEELALAENAFQLASCQGLAVQRLCP